MVLTSIKLPDGRKALVENGEKPSGGGLENGDWSGNRLPRWLTFDRVLLFVVLAFTVGGGIRDYAAADTGNAGQIAAVQTELTKTRQEITERRREVEQTFVRKDVLEQTLARIEAQLSALTKAVEELKK